jgi:endoglycosylceramidase
MKYTSILLSYCRYTNGNGTLDSFASFWRIVANTFVNRSSVLGYELINEPPFPELIDAIEIGEVDRVYLTPMYKKLHEVIRQVDDKHIIFFEPCVADLLQTGLTEGPGGVDYNNRQAFSYHVYCIDVTNQSDPKSDLFCEIDDTFLMSIRYEEAKEKKFGGMMLTEFGGMINSTEGIKEINRITRLADEYFQSKFILEKKNSFFFSFIQAGLIGNLKNIKI